MTVRGLLEQEPPERPGEQGGQHVRPVGHQRDQEEEPDQDHQADPGVGPPEVGGAGGASHL